MSESEERDSDENINTTENNNSDTENPNYDKKIDKHNSENVKTIVQASRKIWQKLKKQKNDQDKIWIRIKALVIMLIVLTSCLMLTC